MSTGCTGYQVSTSAERITPLVCGTPCTRPRIDGSAHRPGDDALDGPHPPYRRTMETITREVTARQLRSELATLVNEAAYGNGRIALHRYGTLVAVLIGLDDFQKLRRFEADPDARERETLDEWAARTVEEDRLRREEEAREARAVEDGDGDGNDGSTPTSPSR